LSSAADYFNHLHETGGYVSGYVSAMHRLCIG
jgi:hypothetical protein